MLLRKLLPLLALCASFVHAELRKDGLVLHLDASKPDSITFNADGKVTVWQDLSGQNHHVTASAKHAPTLIPLGLGAYTVLRFSGKQWMNVPALSDSANGYSIFVVYQRSDAQAGGREWQRLLSATDNIHTDDTKEPGFSISSGKNSDAQEPQISYDLVRSSLHGEMTLGAKHHDHTNGLVGDIVEVLIYDRSFVVFEPINDVHTYLREKWEIAQVASTDWTYHGPIQDNHPQRINDELPLSDQHNAGQWTRFEPMWDEFNGDQLDAGKWWDHNPRWYGRAPSRYLSRNVKVADGMLHITMSKDPTIPEAKLYRNNTLYKDYIAASVVSKEWINYGYFEIRAKPMASAASSAWWFSGTSYDTIDQRRRRIEIDVFEIGGKSIGHESSYNMNAHEFKSEGNPIHYSCGGIWETPEPLLDRYWTFGLEWTPDTIKYYVDGVLVRQLQNDRWHGPQVMLFDTETMVDWLGEPQDSDLPSTFTVDYVRAWTNPVTANDWRKRYNIHNGDKSSITDYVRSMDR